MHPLLDLRNLLVDQLLALLGVDVQLVLPDFLDLAFKSLDLHLQGVLLQLLRDRRASVGSGLLGQFGLGAFQTVGTLVQVSQVLENRVQLHLDRAVMLRERSGGFRVDRVSHVLNFKRLGSR